MQSGNGQRTSGSHARRALLLLACVAAGLGAALAGYRITGAQAWFLAIPAAVALGWLFVANPDECVASRPPNGARALRERD